MTKYAFMTPAEMMEIQVTEQMKLRDLYERLENFDTYGGTLFIPKDVRECLWELAYGQVSTETDNV